MANTILTEQWQDFRIRFQVAFKTHLGGNSAAFQDLWSHGPDVVLLPATGGLQRGWAEVGAHLDSVSPQLHAHDLRLENLLTV